MYSFKVNGKEIHTEKDISLMKFLREELNLVSVKNGCSEGFCGTCSVLLDGRLMKSCVLKTSKLEGKSVHTLEGFSPLEKNVYAHAFEKMGAVQCGFCTPGMIVAAKALIDAKPDPTREECSAAIKGNICRCTGYHNLVKAVAAGAEAMGKGAAPARQAAE